MRIPRSSSPNAAFLARLERACTTWTNLNPQELANLDRALRRVPPSDRFDLLATAFLEDDFLRQSYAGKLLIQSRPPCPHEPRLVLLRLLPKWNLSIEELPFYLEATFGHDAVLSAIEDMDDIQSPLHPKCRTVRFWLHTIR